MNCSVSYTKSFVIWQRQNCGGTEESASLWIACGWRKLSIPLWYCIRREAAHFEHHVNWEGSTACLSLMCQIPITSRGQSSIDLPTQQTAITGWDLVERTHRSPMIICDNCIESPGYVTKLDRYLVRTDLRVFEETRCMIVASMVLPFHLQDVHPFIHMERANIRHTNNPLSLLPHAFSLPPHPTSTPGKFSKIPYRTYRSWKALNHLRQSLTRVITMPQQPTLIANGSIGPKM